MSCSRQCNITCSTHSHNTCCRCWALFITIGNWVCCINVWVSHHLKPCLGHMSWLHDHEDGTMYAVTCARVTGTWRLHICSASLTIFWGISTFYHIKWTLFKLGPAIGWLHHKAWLHTYITPTVIRICWDWTLFALVSGQGPRFRSSASMFSPDEHLFEPLRYMVPGAWSQAPVGWHQCCYLHCDR